METITTVEMLGILTAVVTIGMGLLVFFVARIKGSHDLAEDVASIKKSLESFDRNLAEFRNELAEFRTDVKTTSKR